MSKKDFSVALKYVEARPRSQRRKGAEARVSSIPVGGSGVSATDLSLLNTNLISVTNNFTALKDLFDSMFEKDSEGNIHAKLSLWSSGGITAGGVGSGGSGGGGGISYNRLDSWADYSADKAGWVLSALLGKDLDDRVSALANAGYITQSALAPYALRSEIPSLVGYATQSWVESKNYLTGITSSMVTTALGYTPYNSANFTKDNLKSTLGISDWALASVKPTYTASEVGAMSVYGGTVNGSITATSFTGVINSVAPTALFRAMSYTAGQYSRSASEEDGKIFIGSSVNNKVISSPNYDGTNTAQNIQSLRLAYNSSFFTEIATTPNSNHLWKRNVEAGGANPWERFVTEKAGVTWNISITGNADSATKLATPRTIWGQNFDGTGNVSGDLISNNWRIVTDPTTKGVFLQAALPDGVSDLGYFYITANNGNDLRHFNIWATTTRIKGNVGIGIDYPSEALHVNGNGKFTGSLTATSFIGGTSTISGDLKGLQNLIFADGYLGRKFSLTNSGGVFYQAPSGSVGWATNWSVKSNDGITSFGDLVGAFGVGDSLSYFYFGGEYNAPSIAIMPSGMIAIGGITANEKLHVHGNGKFTGALTANSLTIGGVTITYDSVNEALCINGNMYALGGITAGGAGISAYSSLETRVARLEQKLNIS